MSIRKKISETLSQCKSCGLNDNETAMKVIEELDNMGLSIRGNGWLDGDEDADKILEQANLKLKK